MLHVWFVLLKFMALDVSGLVNIAGVPLYTLFLVYTCLFSCHPMFQKSVLLMTA